MFEAYFVSDKQFHFTLQWNIIAFCKIMMLFSAYLLNFLLSTTVGYRLYIFTCKLRRKSEKCSIFNF